jgi:hypothetical protein
VLSERSAQTISAFTQRAIWSRPVGNDGRISTGTRNGLKEQNSSILSVKEALCRRARYSFSTNPHWKA